MKQAAAMFVIELINGQEMSIYQSNGMAVFTISKQDPEDPEIYRISRFMLTEEQWDALMELRYMIHFPPKELNSVPSTAMPNDSNLKGGDAF